MAGHRSVRCACFAAIFVRRRIAPLTGLPMQPISPALGWCEVPDDRNYNRPVRMPYRASHERMMRDDRLYDACLVLDWNIRPRKRGRGSAIFFHLARPGFKPTEGCVAVSVQTMRLLLPCAIAEKRAARCAISGVDDRTAIRLPAQINELRV